MSVQPRIIDMNNLTRDYLLIRHFPNGRRWDALQLSKTDRGNEAHWYSGYPTYSFSLALEQCHSIGYDFNDGIIRVGSRETHEPHHFHRVPPTTYLITNFDYYIYHNVRRRSRRSNYFTCDTVDYSNTINLTIPVDIIFEEQITDTPNLDELHNEVIRTKPRKTSATKNRLGYYFNQFGTSKLATKRQNSMNKWDKRNDRKIGKM